MPEHLVEPRSLVLVQDALATQLVGNLVSPLYLEAK